MQSQLRKIYESAKAAEEERHAMMSTLTNLATGVEGLQVVRAQLVALSRQINEIKESKAKTVKSKAGPVIQESTRQLLNDQRRQIEGEDSKSYSGYSVVSNADCLNAW